MRGGEAVGSRAHRAGSNAKNHNDRAERLPERQFQAHAVADARCSTWLRHRGSDCVFIGRSDRIEIDLLMRIAINLRMVQSLDSCSLDRSSSVVIAETVCRAILRFE